MCDAGDVGSPASPSRVAAQPNIADGPRVSRVTSARLRALKNARLRTDLEREVPAPQTPTRRESAPARTGPRSRGRVRRGTPRRPPTPPTPTPRWTSRESLSEPMPRSRGVGGSRSRARATARATVRAPPAHPGTCASSSAARSPPARALSTAKTAATPTRARARGPPTRGGAVGAMSGAPSFASTPRRYRRRFRTQRMPSRASASRRRRARRGARCATPRREGARPACRASRASARDGSVPALDRAPRETTARLLERLCLATTSPSRRATCVTRTDARGGASAETVAVSSSSSSSSSAQSGAPVSRAPGGATPGPNAFRRLCVCPRSRSCGQRARLASAPARWGTARAQRSAARA